MSYSNKTNRKHNKNSVFQARPKNVTDYDILWAIRDIPRSKLKLAHKGILAMFVLLIGNRTSIRTSMQNLEDPMGASERSLRDQFLVLEDLNYLIIDRPANYVSGECNEYGLNYQLILSTGKRFSCDKG